MPNREPDPSPRPILIVEDDLDIREALTETLEEQGFAVATAINGRDALEQLRTKELAPSVILLDLMMPVLDGYGLLEELRKDPALAPIPVAILTAGLPIDRSRLPADPPIIPKPINVPRLIGVLRQLQTFGKAG